MFVWLYLFWQGTAYDKFFSTKNKIIVWVSFAFIMIIHGYGYYRWSIVGLEQNKEDDLDLAEETL